MNGDGYTRVDQPYTIDDDETEHDFLLPGSNSVSSKYSINPPVEVAPFEDPQTKRSVSIILATVFMQSVGFTLVLPSLWFYLDDLGGSQAFLGYVVAAYSFGQLVGSTFFGWWSVRSPTIYSLVITLVISIGSNVLYALVVFLPDPPWWLMFSRFMVGVGAGNVSVCRAYASEATPLHMKTSVMAKMSAAQGVGFVLGPGLGYLLSFIHADVKGVPVDAYTSAGYLGAITAFINLILVALYFTEINEGSSDDAEILLSKRKKKQAPVKTTASEMTSILLALFIFFTIVAVFSVFETIGTVLTNADFGWKVQLNGVLFLVAGVISIITFVVISLPFVSKGLDDRVMLMVGLVLLCISLLLLATWPNESHLYLGQFLAGAAIMSIGYPISSALAYSIYAKILNPKQQGTKMGWLTASGSLSRMLGPIWATEAWAIDGGRIVFMSTAGLVGIAIVLALIFWRKLVPHPDYVKAGKSNPKLPQPDEP